MMVILPTRMKNIFPLSRVFKTFSYLLLILVLVISSCGIKNSVKEIFNLENHASNTCKTNYPCQFVISKSNKEKQKVAVKKETKLTSANDHSPEPLTFKSAPKDFPSTRSVPLYILYKQLRTSLV